MINKGVLGYNLYCEGSMIEACMDDWRKIKQRESEVEEG